MRGEFILYNFNSVNLYVSMGLLYVLAKKQAETVHVTFTSDRSLTLSISLGFSLRRVVHVSGRQWLGAWHCVRWAAR